MNIKKILALGSCLVLFTSSLTVNAAEMSESKNVKQINLSEKVSLYGDFTHGYTWLRCERVSTGPSDTLL